MEDPDDKVYGPLDAATEEMQAEMDIDIIQSMMVALGQDVPSTNKAESLKEIQKRIDARMGGQSGRMAIWDEVEE